MKPDKLFIYELEGPINSDSLVQDDNLLGCWNEGKKSYLFFTKNSKDKVNIYSVQFPGIKFISETILDYDQWEPADSLKPFEVSSLKFIPTWNNIPNEDKDVILINPGVVFGGGTHYTTKKCIQFIIDLFINENIDSVIDIGTGTGILSLASVKLGAQKVIAIDNNNLAVETAKNNTKINQLQSINCQQGDALDFIEEEADLVIANLIFPVIKELFSGNKLFNSRYYIVSGLFGTEAHHFKELIKTTGLKIDKMEMDNFWSTFLLKNIRIE